MKASELIEELRKAIEKHGDLDVKVPDRGCGCCSEPDGIEPDSVDATSIREFMIW